jgi:crotonobetaine/carnitine-CoA ligase
VSLRIDLGGLLEAQASRRGERPFVKMVGDENWITYAEFNERANRVAHGLAAIGIRRNDYVCIVLRNCIEYLVFSYALKKIAAVEVSINTEFRGVGLIRLLNLTGAKLVVTESVFIDTLGDIQTNLIDIKRLLFVDGAETLGTPLERFERLTLDDVWSNQTSNPARNVHDTDIAQIQFTSGTTGLSKGLMSPHRHAIRKAEGVADYCGINENDCSYTPWPLFHSGAAHHEVLTVLLTGGRVAIRSRFSASRFWDDIRSVGATWFMIVGSVEAILCTPEPKESDRDNPVRVVFGCPYPVARREFEERFGLKTVDCYGLEDCGYVSSTRPGDGDYTTQGKPRDIYELRIGDESDALLPVGQAGEILIRPREPGVILKGYFGQPEVTSEAFRNGWFHTGDFGRVDENGCLYYLGRLKEVIRRRGENVMPQEVEEVIATHPAVAECVALGVPSDLGEFDVKVCIVLKAGQTLSVNELKKWCNGRLAHFQTPEHVEFMREIPRTPTGKPALAKLHIIEER